MFTKLSRLFLSSWLHGIYDTTKAVEISTLSIPEIRNFNAINTQMLNHTLQITTLNIHCIGIPEIIFINARHWKA